MSFIKRRNMEAIPFIENIISIEIRAMYLKIEVPIIIHQSLNTITRYRGNDSLGHKKIKSRKDKLNSFLMLLKYLYEKKKEKDEKYKDRKIIKIVVAKNNNVHFICEKSK